MKRQVSEFTSAMFLSVFLLLVGGWALPLRAATPQDAKMAITGIVRDTDGPIIGASVVEKGTPSNGTATDMNGKYSLRVSANATLLMGRLRLN
ncbi:hypothetical protein FACS189414_1460 [Bacteroidia bacterium]|nr:hypothetical protein FACS189414_1460 [Bacteroidia bacterium]